VLEAVFSDIDLPNLAGATFGIAAPVITTAPIPLPASALLLLGGLGALGVARRRARA
jgi:hypothetical protein